MVAIVTFPVVTGKEDVSASASEMDDKAPAESVSGVKSVGTADDSAKSDKVTTGTSPPPQNMSTQVLIL